MYKAKYYLRPSEPPFDSKAGINGSKVIVEFYKNGVFTTQQWNFSDINRIDKISDSCYIVAFQNKPIQSLEFQDELFVKELQTLAQGRHLKMKIQVKPAARVVWSIILISFLLVSLLVATYIYGLPLLAERVAGKFPHQLEKELGEKLFRTNITGLEIDSALTRQSQLFFNTLGITSDTISVTVLKSKEINAYAMPGGFIVVYDSILKIMKGPNEYAALLAHEYAHIKYRHSLKGMVRQMAGSAMIGLVTGDPNGAAAILVNQADKLKGLQYSRTMEQQADEEAVSMLFKANINPGGTLELFKNMKNATSGAGQSGFEFLSTHPQFVSREKYLKGLIESRYNKENNWRNLDTLWNKMTNCLR